MKRKFTFLIAAAVMLLTMMATTGRMWGQTRETQTVSYGWETTDNATPWTISNAIVATSGEGNTGSYAGRINTNSTTVQFNEKVYVTSFSYAFKRTSNNNNYSVYIETSTDGSTWSIKDTQAMNTFTNGSYRTVTKEFDGSQELYVRFRCNNTTAVRYVDDVTITYATGASQLDPCDLTLTNASTSIVFDLYNNLVPFVINYTTSSTGTVSVAENDYVETVVDQVNKTITVTPIAITNGAKVITVNQAADDNYAAGSKTFTINITDSTPFSGGNVTFDATTDTGTSPLVKNGVTFACTNGVLNNGSEYRLYKNSVTTFSVTQGNITQIAFTGTSGNPASGFGSQTGWTTNGDNGTWTGEATEVSFTASGAQVRATQIIVTVESSSDSAVHTTTTINVPINFNTDIQQGTNAGTLTATVTVTSDGSEVSGATVTWESSNTSVATIDANGAVTLVAVGTTTITASYAGVEDQYKPSEGTYPLTVSDSNAPGTVNNPYTVTAAIAATPTSGTSNYVYIHGIVSAFYGSSTSIIGDGNNYRYYISDDGSTDSQLLVYKGKGLNEVTFSSADDLHIGDIVTIYGGLTMYQSEPEIASGNYLTAWERPAVDVEAPTFSVAAGGYAEAQTVEIACATDGAQIYYTTDGSTPDNTKTAYTEAITVSQSQTIKAIAYVGENTSAVSSAAYYILSDDNTYTVAEALAFETYPQNNIFVEGIVSTAPTSLISGGLLTYYISADGTSNELHDNELQVYKGKNLGNTPFTVAGEIVAGDRVTIFGNVKIYNNTTEFDQGNYLITLEGYTYPVINADNINIAHDATSGTITYTVEHYLAGTMTASTEADWISNFNTATNGQVSFTTTANPNEEARVAQVTLTFTDITENFQTKVVTVTQAAHVDDYAELPFWFNSGRDDIATTAGLTQYGLGEDLVVNDGYYLNFDDAGDWVVLKTNEAPGIVNFNIYAQDFSGGTFKMQTSADGETYSDLAVYTSIDGEQFDQIYQNYDESVRYVRWIYTEKSSGSVGIKEISVSKFVSPIKVFMPDPENPSSIIENYTFATSSASYQGQWMLQVNNTNIGSLDQYSIVFCHSDGTQLESNEEAPDWLTNYFANLQVNEYYATCTYNFTINANTSTSPREAYFRFKCVIDETSYYSLPVTVTQEGYVPQNYTVTFNTNDGEFVANQDFSSTSTNVVEGEHNLPSATKDGYTFMGWSDGTQTYAANAVYNVTANVNFTAQWGSFEWVATPLADLTAEDVFVIVGDNGDTYAMSNDNGTSNAPSAVEVTVANNKLSGNIDANIQWNLSISDDGYMFYPNGDSESWLYCNNANNGLRIGTGDNKHFSLADDGYITITETTKQRYLGIYNSQDWRSYENTTGNIANQTFAFYKRVEALPPSIYLGDDHDIGNHFGTGLVTWEYIDVKQTGLTEDITLTASIGTLSPDQIAAGAGTTEVEWTHTFNETGDFDVTITATSGEIQTSIHITGTVRQTYYINTNIAEHGSIDTYLETALQGDHILFTIIPDEGYMPDEVTVMAGETPVEFSARPHAINQFEFDMPESDVTISVTFKESVYEQYELFSGELVEGDYLIVYNNVAMIADRTYGYNLQYKTVAPENDIISTDNAAMVWHLAPSATVADYWTICNPARDLYLMANQWGENIVFLDVLSSYDDEAVWTVTGTETYEFVNKYAVENDHDANLRYNENVGFSCYSTSVGGALSLYKKVDNSPSITLSSYEIEATAEGGDGTLDVTYNNITTVIAEVNFYESDGTTATTYDWITAEIDDNDNVYYVIDANDGEARTAYFKVYALDDNAEDVYSNLVTINQTAYVPPVVTDDYELFSGELVEGDYIIYYNGKAMMDSVVSNRLYYKEVNPSNNVISTGDASIVWHIAPNGDYWTIYSADAVAYAASTNSKNQATLYQGTPDSYDNALWTASGTETYEFENKARAAASTDSDKKWLRNNGNYGFACYATGTGGALSLYKKVDNTPSLSFNGPSANIGTYPTGEEITWGNIIVSQHNLTDSISLSAKKGTVTPKSIDAGAEPTQVTWSYKPTTAGYTVDTITATSGTVEATFLIQFVAKTPHNINITSVENGTIAIVGGKTTEIEGENVDFTVTPDEGYELATLTVVDEGNNPIDYVDNTSFYRFQMPNSDVTISATFTALPTYTVSFSVNGTVDSELTVTVTTGSSIEDLPTESTWTPDGFTIYGWAEANSTEAVAEPYKPTGDVILYALLQLENAPATSENYVKVTEELTDWSGEYLIVYEDGGLAFNGSLETLDAKNNTIEVTITNNTIGTNTTTDASMFTIAALSEGGYSIQSASGYYIGQTSDANGLASSTETVYVNTISYDEDHVNIISSGGAYLRYNSASDQARFRYFKSSTYTAQKAIQLYKKTSGAAIPTIINVAYVSDTTSMSTNIPESTCYVVEDGAVLTFTGTNEGTAANLVVQEGGQLIHTTDVEATVQKGVSAYTSKSGDGWYLISSPVDNLPTSSVATGTYDLFAYDEATAYWWVDHAIPGQTANHTFTTLERGKGYLYANTTDVYLNYAGTMKATNANISVDLSYDCDDYPDLKGFNLVGNPYTRNIVAGNMRMTYENSKADSVVTVYYDFNDERTEFVTYMLEERPIQPGQGFFIQAGAIGQTLQFTSQTDTKDANGYIRISAGDENFTDKAYIQFGGGNTLRKMTFSGNKSQVYVMHHHEDYAAARIYSTTGSVPVNFEAAYEGIYTITLEAKNLDLETLRLIDNMTGDEIDLLAEPSYTFKANSDEPAERFTLLFEKSILGIDENNAENEVFAYQNGSEIYLSGEGTLQVFDVMGRYVASYEVNGSKRISTSLFNAGVYIFKMNGEKNMTQKIVVR